MTTEERTTLEANIAEAMKNLKFIEEELAQFDAHLATLKAKRDEIDSALIWAENELIDACLDLTEAEEEEAEEALQDAV